MFRIVAALVFAALLIASGWKVGKNTVQAEWNAEKLVQATEALNASEAARAKDQALTEKARKKDEAYQLEKKRLVANAVVSANRLRDYQAASDSAARSNTATTSRADGPYRAISDQCSAALVKLDEYAQNVAGKARALQDYTREMRLTP